MVYSAQHSDVWRDYDWRSLAENQPSLAVHGFAVLGFAGFAQSLIDFVQLNFSDGVNDLAADFLNHDDA